MLMLIFWNSSVSFNLKTIHLSYLEQLALCREHQPIILTCEHAGMCKSSSWMGTAGAGSMCWDLFVHPTAGPGPTCWDIFFHPTPALTFSRHPWLRDVTKCHRMPPSICLNSCWKLKDVRTEDSGSGTQMDAGSGHTTSSLRFLGNDPSCRAQCV